jgi:ABC-type uncharacterized transport system permease subunit
MQLISWATLQGSLELGIIYAIMALGVFISFRTLNMPDLTVDSSFTLGAAVSAIMVSISQPFTGLAFAFLAGFIGVKTLLRRLIAVVLGAVVYRFVITVALWLGMPPTDLKLVSAVIVAGALSMTVINEKFQSWKNKRANGGCEGGQM